MRESSRSFAPRLRANGEELERQMMLLHEWVGLGLRNVHRRLVQLFGADYGLQIDSASGEGTTVHLILPLSPGIISSREGGNLGCIS